MKKAPAGVATPAFNFETRRNSLGLFEPRLACGRKSHPFAGSRRIFAGREMWPLRGPFSIQYSRAVLLPWHYLRNTHTLLSTFRRGNNVHTPPTRRVDYSSKLCLLEPELHIFCKLAVEGTGFVFINKSWKQFWFVRWKFEKIHPWSRAKSVKFRFAGLLLFGARNDFTVFRAAPSERARVHTEKLACYLKLYKHAVFFEQQVVTAILDRILSFTPNDGSLGIFLDINIKPIILTTHCRCYSLPAACTLI